MVAVLVFWLHGELDYSFIIANLVKSLFNLFNMPDGGLLHPTHLEVKISDPLEQIIDDDEISYLVNRVWREVCLKRIYRIDLSSRNVPWSKKLAASLAQMPAWLEQMVHESRSAISELVQNLK